MFAISDIVQVRFQINHESLSVKEPCLDKVISKFKSSLGWILELNNILGLDRVCRSLGVCVVWKFSNIEFLRGHFLLRYYANGNYSNFFCYQRIWSVSRTFHLKIVDLDTRYNPHRLVPNMETSYQSQGESISGEASNQDDCESERNPVRKSSVFLGLFITAAIAFLFGFGLVLQKISHPSEASLRDSGGTRDLYFNTYSLLYITVLNRHCGQNASHCTRLSERRKAASVVLQNIMQISLYYLCFSVRWALLRLEWKCLRRYNLCNERKQGRLVHMR